MPPSSILHPVAVPFFLSLAVNTVRIPIVLFVSWCRVIMPGYSMLFYPGPIFVASPGLGLLVDSGLFSVLTI
jgi:hypothetical protein